MNENRSVHYLKCWLWLGIAVLGLSPSAVRADATDDFNVLVNFYRDERWEQAVSSAEAYLDTYPTDDRVPLVRLYLGQSLIRQADYQRGRDVFRDFIEQHEGHQDLPLAMYRAGECSYFLRDWEAAERELSAFVTDHSENGLSEWALEYLAESQLRLEKGDEAAATFETFLERFAESRLRAEAEYGLAQARELQGRDADALALYQTIADDRTHSRAPDAWFRIGRNHFEANRHEEAAAAFSQVHIQFPQHRLAQLAELNAGSSRYHLQQFAEAIEHFTKAADDPELTVEAGFWKGLCEKGLGNFEQAAATLIATADSAGEDQTTAEKATFHAADCEYRLQRFEPARDRFLVVVDRFPTGDYADDGLYSAIECSLQLKNYDEAVALHERFRTGYAQSGLRMLEEILHARVLLSRGDSRLTTDPNAANADFAAARDALQSVVGGTEIPRTANLARIQLARCFERLQQPEEVVTTLQPVIDELQGAMPNAEFVEALLVQSKVLLDLGRYSDIAPLTTLYLSLGGSQQPEALSFQALAQAHLDDRAGCDATLDQLAAIPDTGELLQSTTFAIGEVAYDRKQWEWAMENYDRSVNAAPASTAVLGAQSGKAYSAFEWARELKTAGEETLADQWFHEAADVFAQLLDSSSDDLLLLSAAAHMQGLALSEAGDQQAAVTAFRAGFERFRSPDATAGQSAQEIAYNAYRCAKGAARASRALADIPAADQMYASAHGMLKDFAAEMQGDLPHLIQEWALLHYDVEDFARSDEIFTLLVAECPDTDLTDDAKLYLAESRFFADDMPGAKTALSELAQSDKSDDFVRHRSLELLLDVAARLQDWDLAVTASADLTRLFPESAAADYANYRRAEAQLQRDELDAAAQILQSLADRRDEPALAGQTWLPSIWLLLAETRLRQRDYAAVTATLDEFDEVFPDSEVAYQADEIRGRSLLLQAMFDEAREAFTAVVDSEAGRRTETAAKAQFFIAESHLTQRDYEAALRAYYNVYVNYDFPEWQSHALFQAGECDAALERWSDAAASYQKLIDEFPESEHVTAATEKLQMATMRAGM
jgi:TolA-binding protein